MSNYRPISHFSFLSKLTERVVKSRVTDFLTIFSTHFSLLIPHTMLQKLLFMLFMIISSEPVASNKFLAYVFLIFMLHLIPLIILFFLNASHLGLVSQVLLWIKSNLALRLGLSMSRLEILSFLFISFCMVSPRFCSWSPSVYFVHYSSKYYHL
jgi:hypothetical protein